jgi:hypothetical protein
MGFGAWPRSIRCILRKIIDYSVLEKSFDINYAALLGYAPAALASPIAIVPYYQYAIVEKFFR